MLPPNTEGQRKRDIEIFFDDNDKVNKVTHLISNISWQPSLFIQDPENGQQVSPWQTSKGTYTFKILNKWSTLKSAAPSQWVCLHNIEAPPLPPTIKSSFSSPICWVSMDVFLLLLFNHQITPVSRKEKKQKEKKNIFRKRNANREPKKSEFHFALDVVACLDPPKKKNNNNKEEEEIWCWTNICFSRRDEHHDDDEKLNKFIVVQREWMNEW